MCRRILGTTSLVLLVLPGAAVSGEAAARKRIACTLPTVEAIVREVGGDRVDAFSLSAGDQDPHFVSPTPALMSRVRKADLLVEIGMQLEIWADEVANGSGNPRLFRGAPGRVTLATGIPKLELPSLVTRAQGDIHPEGNPHLWLDPVRVKLLAENVAKALKAASPEDAAHFESRLRGFQNRLDQAMFGNQLIGVVGAAKLTRLVLDGRLHAFLESNRYQEKKLIDLAGGWLARAALLRSQKVVEFHKVWVYFASAFSFELVGTIEEKPGIAPGPRHVSRTVEEIKRQNVKLILVDNFYDASLPQRIAKEGGARVVTLPNQVRGEKGVDDYFALIDHVLGAMITTLREQRASARP